MRFSTKNIFLFTSLLFIFIYLPAQRPIYYDAPEYQYKIAVELLQKEKFGSAQQYFKEVYENTFDKQQDIKSNSYFYMGICAAQLYNEDAIFLLKDFIRQYPVHSFVPEAYYYLGKFYFYKKQYKKVLESFSNIDERHVRPSELAEFRFKTGYSYFATKNYDEATALLNQARLAEGPYQKRAIYYLAHIAYQNQNYESALEDFLLLKDDPEYQDLVPYYIVQIYFLQKRYEELISVAPSLFEKTNDKNKSDIARSLALSYYNLGMYKNAEEYFNFYLNDKKNTPDRNDNFAAGFTFYNTENFKDAITYLSRTTKDTIDIITQTALYVIGDCYLKNQQLPQAKQSFLEASKLDISNEIQEDALYNYAKLEYETSSQPFNNAIKALEEYMNRYPYSSRSQEAQSYLSTIYMSTKNYQGAIKSLEKISGKSPTLLRAYQRCTYFRALELIDNKDYKKAISLLDKSLSYPLDETINLSAYFWKGESQYRNSQFSEALQTLKTYQKQHNASNDENFINSYYTIGYSALKLKKYREAETAFNKVLNSSVASNNTSMQADATARIADCYFMQKKINQALNYYEKCGNLNDNNGDYALYQQAKCQGYLRNNNKKITLLENFLNKYKRSAYIDDAEFELASTLHTENRYSQAITAYQNFIDKHPKSKYIRQAYNKMAQAYLNTKNTDMAINTFKFVFENYQGSQEAKDALNNLENIYTELGTTGEFFDYISHRNYNYSEGKQDSVSYKSAENKYLIGDCEMAIRGFDSYLSKFPKGLFAANAYFYKGECEYGNKSYEKALESYISLLEQYNTENNEIATKKVSSILFNKKDYAQAQYYFSKLTDCATSSQNVIYGNNGMMRCSYELTQYRKSLVAAENLINNSAVDEELLNEALLYAGRDLIFLEEWDNAKKYLTRLAKNGNNDICSEAAYLLAKIELMNNNLSACEEKIKDVIGGDYRSEYWIAKTFILYGDYYKAKENYFQARYTFQSIVDNYEGEDLRQEARNKIAEIDALESPVDTDASPKANPTEPDSE